MRIIFPSAIARSTGSTFASVDALVVSPLIVRLTLFDDSR
jgi:hypothetical protein